MSIYYTLSIQLNFFDKILTFLSNIKRTKVYTHCTILISTESFKNSYPNLPNTLKKSTKSITNIHHRPLTHTYRNAAVLWYCFVSERWPSIINPPVRDRSSPCKSKKTWSKSTLCSWQFILIQYYNKISMGTWLDVVQFVLSVPSSGFN